MKEAPIRPTAGDDAWYPDFGASNHVISDLNNLNIGAKYRGRNIVKIVNGGGLSISYVGCSVLALKSPSSISKKIDSKNLLHVPSITKELISVLYYCHII